jgi:lysyl-tRNA synthetase class 2
MNILGKEGVKLDLSRRDVREQLEHFCQLHGLVNREWVGRKTVAKLFDKLVGKFVEPLCQEPTILTGFPLFTSPLAAKSHFNPLLADRLEVFINGMEVANGYQELADAEEQQHRFEEQLAERKRTGDLDTPLPDAGYVEALRLGMPPTIGLGVGVDRLVMLLTRKRSIKEVILFT